MNLRRVREAGAVMALIGLLVLPWYLFETPQVRAQSGFTPGSVIFAGAAGTLAENDSKFYWDNSSYRLRIIGDASSDVSSGGVTLRIHDTLTLGHANVQFTSQSLSFENPIDGGDAVLFQALAMTQPTTTRIWVQNNVAYKNHVSTDPTHPGVVTALELGLKNVTDEAGEPGGGGEATALIISIIDDDPGGHQASAGLRISRFYPSWLTNPNPQGGLKHGIHIDAIKPPGGTTLTQGGNAITVDDVTSLNAGMARGLDLSRVARFSEAAIALGNSQAGSNHRLAAVDSYSTLRNLIKLFGMTIIIGGDPSPDPNQDIVTVRSNQIFLQRQTGEGYLAYFTPAPAPGFTSMALSYNINGTLTGGWVYIGAPSSCGSGFRCLSVVN